MVVSFDISEELAKRVRPVEDQLPRILELGLRELNAAPRYEGVADVVEMLAGLPAPEEILALHPSAPMQRRISSLLEKNRSQGLLPAEEQEWEQYQYLEHVVRLAKAKASFKLKASQPQ